MLDRAVARGGAGGADRVDHLAAVVVGHLAEDGVLAVEPAGRPDRDEELRPVGTGAGVRHREQVGPGELEVRVDLVTELVPRAAPSGTGGVAALDHEAADHPVEDGAVVVRATARLPGTRIRVLLAPFRQTYEVPNRLRAVVVKH